MRALPVLLALLFSTLAQAATLNNCSTTIAAGGTAQTLVNFSASNLELIVQNVSKTEGLFLALQGDAALSGPGSIVLAPAVAGNSTASSIFMLPSMQGVSMAMTISVNAATTGHPITCYFW